MIITILLVIIACAVAPDVMAALFSLALFLFLGAIGLGIICAIIIFLVNVFQ